MYDKFDRKIEQLFIEFSFALKTGNPIVIHREIKRISEAEELQLSEARRMARANLRGEGDSFIVAEGKV